MRWIMAAAAFAAMMQGAQAADLPDMPVLRGGFADAPPRVMDWRGFYLGGQAGYGTTDMNFQNSAQSMLGRLLNNVDVEAAFGVSAWPLLGTTRAQSVVYGGFAGYNTQWDEVILGAEFSYMRGDFNGSASGTQGRNFMNFPQTEYNTSTTLTANAGMRVTDLSSLRVRGGYAVGSFLPYMFGGVALGRADLSRSASYAINYRYVGTSGYPSFGPFGDTASEVKKGEFVYGYSAGLGVDMMLFSNLFVRAEWEYLRFTSQTDASINSFRGGVGYKF